MGTGQRGSGWGLELARAARDARSERWSGTAQAWHAVDFLLDRLGFEIPLVLGAESFVALPDVDPDSPEILDFMENLEHHWGYGPPAYLTPEQVAAAAAQLDTFTDEDLVHGVDPAELAQADIYPGSWEQPGKLAWVTHFLPDARTFFAMAAKEGDAVICWLD